METPNQTQENLILDAFRRNFGILTPSDIMKLGIAQYNARIFGLRKKGHQIDNEFLGIFNGVKHTQFVFHERLQANLLPKKTLSDTVKEYAESKDLQHSLAF
jgi:hypothetical protein